MVVDICVDESGGGRKKLKQPVFVMLDAFDAIRGRQCVSE